MNFGTYPGIIQRSRLGQDRWVVTDTGTTMVPGTSYLSVNSNAPTPSDPLWSNVAALLSFEGSNGGTTVIDDASNGWTASGGFTTSTARAQFGTSSGAFTTASALLTTPSQTRFDMPGDFCIDLWFWRPASLGATNVIGRGGGAAANEWIIYMAADGTMRFHTQAADVVSTGILPADTWSAVRFNRSGTTISSYLNGTRSQTTTRNNNFTNTLAISTSFNGQGPAGANIDEFRLTVGAARETDASYTVATSAFPRLVTQAPLDFAVPASISPGDSFVVSASVGTSRVVPGAGRQIGSAGVGTAVTLNAGQTLRTVVRTDTQLEIV